MSQPLPTPRVDRATMADVFGEDDLDTVAEEAAEQISHAPTRVFLTTVGLPDQEDTQGWFHRVEDLTEEVEDKGWPGLGEKYPEVADDFHFDEWVTLGEIPYDSINVDASTGVVYATSDDGGEPYLLNTSLEVFAYLICVTEAERPFYEGPEEDFEEPGYEEQVEARLERLYGMPYEQVGPTAADRLRATIERTDPVALARPDSIWHQVVRHITGGLH
ncbi:SUKH-4 family immunity protein [Streptacidiphilus pinicola]|nr:SUKH-4 family immunity protein [Streptacidiphilus pinicola]